MANATPEATNQHAQDHAHLSYRELGTTGLQVSEAGFGTYRVDTGMEQHEKALAMALREGINLIDTSTNYADGRSEQLVGQVLRDLINEGELTREQVVVVSKAGYIQGSTYEMVQQRKAAGEPFPNVVKYAEGLDHCVHPDFLADQLTRSLERLGLETIDVYLLHNPEYYLQWARKATMDAAQAQESYYQRVRLAFEHLEQEVADGRICHYGISSNTFPGPRDHYDTTHLDRCWQMARDIADPPRFHVIQLPMNLLETGAATEKNQRDAGGNALSALQFAQQVGLGVLVNRPLNAIQNNALTRLANVDMPNYPAPVEEVSTAVDTLVQMEAQFQDEILPQLALPAQTAGSLPQLVAIGQMLQGQWRGFGAYQNWCDLRGRFLIPRAQTALQFLSNRENLPAAAVSWLDEYIDEVNMTLAAVTAFYQEQGHNRMKHLQETAVAADPDWQADTLSQTAVRALRSTAGVTSVLVGMRHPRYVQDVIADLQDPVEAKNRNEAWEEMGKAVIRKL